MRPDKTQYFLDMAALVATRSTCLRRAVGCVLVDARGHVLATGYNGVAAGAPHCNEPYRRVVRTGSVGLESSSVEYPHACAGAKAASGTRLDDCEAIHAEANALLQCRDVYAIATAYVTDVPCVSCTKFLLNSSCELVVAAKDYAGSGADLWLRRGRRLIVDGGERFVDHEPE